MNKTTMTWSRDPLNSTGVGAATNGFAGYIWEQRSLGQCPETYIPGGAEGYEGWQEHQPLRALPPSSQQLLLQFRRQRHAACPPRAGSWKGSGLRSPARQHLSRRLWPCRALDETTYVYSENHLHALTWVLGRWQNGVRVAGIGAPVNRIDMAPLWKARTLMRAGGSWAGKSTPALIRPGTV
jgi:hypothetical protein